jgi:hypothetical protein
MKITYKAFTSDEIVSIGYINCLNCRFVKEMIDKKVCKLVIIDEKGTYEYDERQIIELLRELSARRERIISTGVIFTALGAMTIGGVIAFVSANANHERQNNSESDVSPLVNVIKPGNADLNSVKTSAPTVLATPPTQEKKKDKECLNEQLLSDYIGGMRNKEKTYYKGEYESTSDFKARIENIASEPINEITASLSLNKQPSNVDVGIRFVYNADATTLSLEISKDIFEANYTKFEEMTGITMFGVSKKYNQIKGYKYVLRLDSNNDIDVQLAKCKIGELVGNQIKRNAMVIFKGKSVLPRIFITDTRAEVKFHSESKDCIKADLSKDLAWDITSYIVKISINDIQISTSVNETEYNVWITRDGDSIQVVRNDFKDATFTQ